jgi:hypothetical protein
MRKGQLKFYKGSGAAQFRLIPPKLTPGTGYVWKDGAILLEVAPGSGRGRDLSWDWKRKITFAISYVDIIKMMDDGDNVDIFHDSEGTPKKLMIQPGETKGWFLTVAEGKGDKRHSISVPLTDGEWRVLRTTMLNMVPFLCGWQDGIEEEER